VMWVNEYVRDRTAIQTYLSAADLYTLPSRKEGFPVAPLEAMACHLPIVATDVAGISDILEYGEASGGMIVPYESIDALALKIGQLLDNATRAQVLGQRARERVEQSFSFEVIGQQLKDLLVS
jgi:glycosyltransferase involved in cell wall biosynthesis